MKKGKKSFTVTQVSDLDLLWKEIEMRQAHYWNSFNRFGIVIIIVIVAPFMRPDLIDSYYRYVLLFPALSFALTLICTWYLAAEYQRLRMIWKKYTEIRNNSFKIERMPTDTRWQRLVAKRIGTTTTVIWFAVFSTLSIISAFLLWTSG